MFPWVRKLATITSVHSADIRMSAYFKGPAMGYINSTPGNMEPNQDTNNSGINGTSVNNRRALPGSRVYVEMEGQGPGSRHQATGHKGRQEDAAEMGTTAARLKKRWTKDENKEIWRCYKMNDPAM